MFYKSNRFTTGKPSLVDLLKDKIRYKDRCLALQYVPKLDAYQVNLLNKLNKTGYIVLNDYIQTPLLKTIQIELENAFKNLQFNTPCLAQSKIDLVKHASLINRHMSATAEELDKLNVAFNKADCINYEQVINDFRPSTLTVNMLNTSKTYLDICLDPYLLAIISNYMNLVPQLTEAYTRRNFPATHKTMNHFWHRDMNHHSHLIKMFVFISDCTEMNGPHEYISGSCTEKEKMTTLNNKSYYSDEEINIVYPQNSKDRILSKVSAGTIVIEDTRGLHRANVPTIGQRDLGYAIFTPALLNNPALYELSFSKYKKLSAFQKLFIPKQCLIK